MSKCNKASHTSQNRIHCSSATSTLDHGLTHLLQSRSLLCTATSILNFATELYRARCAAHSFQYAASESLIINRSTLVVVFASRAQRKKRPVGTIYLGHLRHRSSPAYPNTQHVLLQALLRTRAPPPPAPSGPARQHYDGRTAPGLPSHYSALPPPDRIPARLPSALLPPANPNRILLRVPASRRWAVARSSLGPVLLRPTRLRPDESRGGRDQRDGVGAEAVLR